MLTERLQALEAITALATGRFVAPDELERIVDEEREDSLPELQRRLRD